MGLKRAIGIILLLAASTTLMGQQGYRICLGSYAELGNAVAARNRLRSAGFKAELEEAIVRGRTYTRVILNEALQDAEAASRRVSELREHTALRALRLAEPWVVEPSAGFVAAKTAIDGGGRDALSTKAAKPAVAEPIDAAMPLRPMAPDQVEDRVPAVTKPGHGLVKGTVLDSLTGEGLPDVRVSAGDGSVETLSDREGKWQLEAPAGKTQIRFSKRGYEFEPIAIEVKDGQAAVLPESAAVGNPSVSAGQYRFVLTWGRFPYDLDSHLITPSGDHVFFANKRPYGAGADLDVDDTSSYGPETTTIRAMENGTYAFFVHNYSGVPDMANSGALVRLYGGNGLIESLRMPQAGVGDVWFVGILNAGGFRRVDRIMDAIELEAAIDSEVEDSRDEDW